jgi:hypothetical protein
MYINNGKSLVFRDVDEFLDQLLKRYLNLQGTERDPVCLSLQPGPLILSTSGNCVSILLVLPTSASMLLLNSHFG